MDVTKLIGTLAGLAIVALLGIAYRELSKYLAMNKFLQAADVAVRAWEQRGLIRGMSGEEKKALVVSYLRKFADMLKLRISDEDLDNIVEAGVQIINDEAGKFLKEVLVPDEH